MVPSAWLYSIKYLSDIPLIVLACLLLGPSECGKIRPRFTRPGPRILQWPRWPTAASTAAWALLFESSRIQDELGRSFGLVEFDRVLLGNDISAYAVVASRINRGSYQPWLIADFPKEPRLRG